VHSGGVAGFGLQSPHETWTGVRPRVHRRDLGDESGHTRIVERRLHPGDIELGEVMAEDRGHIYYRNLAPVGPASRPVQPAATPNLCIGQARGLSHRPAWYLRERSRCAVER